MKTYAVYLKAYGQRLKIGQWTVSGLPALWDRVAYHYQYTRFKTMCEVQGLDPKKTKERFDVVRVA